MMKSITFKIEVRLGNPPTKQFDPHVAYLVPNGLVEAARNENVHSIENVEEVPEDIRHKANRRPEDGQRILIVRHGGFGDWLMLTPLIRYLKEAFIPATIDCAIDKHFVDAIRSNPHINKIIPTSYVPINWLRSYDRVYWFNKTIEKDEFTTKTGTEIFGEQMEIELSELSSRRPEYHVDRQAVETIRRLIGDGVLRRDVKRIAIQVAGSSLRRTWPLHNTIKLFTGLASIPGVDVFLVGQFPAQVPGYDMLRKAATVCPGVFNFVNQTRCWSDAAALISECDLFIGPDSSFAHVCDAIGKEAIVMYGPVNAATRCGHGESPHIHVLENGPAIGTERFHCQPCFDGAFKPCIRAIQNKESGGWSPCLAAITPELVFDKAVKLLGLENEKHSPETLHRNQHVQAVVHRVWRPEEHFEVSREMVETSVQLGIIHGGAPQELLERQLGDLLRAHTTRAFDDCRITVLNNGQKTAIPKKIQGPEGSLYIGAVHAEKMKFPPVPYNDLLALWQQEEPVDWYVLMDDDVINFKPDWLAKLITRAKEMHLHVWGMEFADFGERFPNLGYKNGFASAVIGISAYALAKLGYFDESFIWHGFDSDYVARAHLAGVNAGVIPGSLKLAEHVGSVASRRRGIEHTIRAVVSNKHHHQRWRWLRAPLVTKIRDVDVKERRFTEIGLNGDMRIERHDRKPPQRIEKVSAVIPTVKNPRKLMAAVQSLEGQVGEIIIVIDGKHPETERAVDKILAGASAEIAQHIKVFQDDKRRGFSAAVNKGMQAAKEGNDILIFNDDAIADKCLVRELSVAMRQRGHIGIVCSQHLDSFTGMDLAAHAETVSDPEPIRNGLLRMDWAGFCCVLMNRQMVDEIGLLDAQHFPQYSSDKEYCLRARARGWEVVLAVNAKAIHEGGATMFRLASDPTTAELFKQETAKRLENMEYMQRLRGTPKDPKLHIVKRNDS